jgi:hypothetical protein
MRAELRDSARGVDPPGYDGGVGATVRRRPRVEVVVDLVKVESFPSRALADLAASALRAAGLNPRVTGDESAAITGMWAFGGNEIDVFVPADEHDLARGVLSGTG